MDIKCVLATLLLGTVFANLGNTVYKCMPLDPMESDSSAEVDSESNCNIKEYIGEIFGNISNRLGRKYNSNGTDLATKEDILEMKQKCVEESQNIIRLEEDIAELKKNLDSKSTTIVEYLKPKPIDCEDIQNNGYHTTGIYTIYIKRETSAISVRCDMDTSYGGWIVIQRRVSNSEFYKPWREYEAGFGKLTGNFWLGLRNMHLITKRAKYELRVDLSSMNGETAFAYYDEFAVGSAESSFKLTVDGYSGTAGDSLTYHNGMKFSTYDQDNDRDTRHCASAGQGAWWYNGCHKSNLNGDYGNTKDGKGNVWSHWKGYFSPLLTTEMKIRRIV